MYPTGVSNGQTNVNIEIPWHFRPLYIVVGEEVKLDTSRFNEVATIRSPSHRDDSHLLLALFRQKYRVRDRVAIDLRIGFGLGLEFVFGPEMKLGIRLKFEIEHGAALVGALCRNNLLEPFLRLECS